jgi:uncharacterized protein
MANTFLRAEWRKLLMINYAVDPQLLKPYLPRHTELDFWDGVCYASVVGFMFLNTRIKGFKIPFHVNFEEVNLRFYVRYREHDQWKRGVVFIKEIVPKPAIGFIANTLYREHYETLPMSHRWEVNGAELTVEYKWKKGRWNSIRASADKTPAPISDDSVEAFIAEHYWGYSKINAEKTGEYAVEHPQWEAYKILDFNIDVDFNATYGPDFGFLAETKPRSVLLAEGSEVRVLNKRRV